jgi:2-(1,2-epoxy-1,2-dihydrophenyl)acetyl-CoA isomerase
MADSTFVLQTFENGVLTLTLSRPERANALNQEMILALQSALKQAAQTSTLRCVLLTGAGADFSSGHDLGEMGAEGSPSYRSHLQRTYNPLIMQLRRLEVPVLAALKGAVAGAALGLALACDLRIASETTRFTVGFLGIGLAPDSGVSLLLPAVVGLGKASELAFNNQSFSAKQALDWGLVNRIVAAGELPAQAAEWAAQLTRGPVGAMGLTKRAFNRAVLPNLEDLLDYEAHLQAVAQHRFEHKEGVQAFLEKRPPVFALDEA